MKTMNPNRKRSNREISNKTEKAFLTWVDENQGIGITIKDLRETLSDIDGTDDIRDHLSLNNSFWSAINRICKRNSIGIISERQEKSRVKLHEFYLGGVQSLTEKEEPPVITEGQSNEEDIYESEYDKLKNVRLGMDVAQMITEMIKVYKIDENELLENINKAFYLLRSDIRISN